MVRKHCPWGPSLLALPHENRRSRSGTCCSAFTPLGRLHVLSSTLWSQQPPSTSSPGEAPLLGRRPASSAAFPAGAMPSEEPPSALDSPLMPLPAVYRQTSVRPVGAFQEAAAGLLGSDRCLQLTVPPASLCCWGRARAGHWNHTGRTPAAPFVRSVGPALEPVLPLLGA